MSNEQYDSVWDAIEDTPEMAENMKIRSALMMIIEDHIKTQGWTQIEAARYLHVTQPRVSDLMRGKIDLFAIDALVSMLSATGYHVELHAVKAA